MIKKVSVNSIQKFKDRDEKFSVLTAYDYSTAKYLDEAGIDVILIGDSLAMVALGYNDTRQIGVEEMQIFTRAVARGVSRAMVITDMPYMSYHTDVKTALENTSLMIKNGATAVKIEGCNEHTIQVVKRCVECGIPVVSHLGFTPQFLNTIGGYNIQGKTYDATLKILDDAQKLQDAGAFSILLEMVPEESAKYITENLRVPTISCGAGKYCTGQVLVSDDVLGKYSDFTPKFARKYGDMKNFIIDCAKRFDEDVKSGMFPSDSEVFHVDEECQKMLYCRK
ncbi:3-methyl-2-oxobutanoate hydroxymethyltransferase [bacterium]|nr:3-methyl-2-oxobutanoate hydroxymethyltransferase [bacterium]